MYVVATQLALSNSSKIVVYAEQSLCSSFLKRYLSMIMNVHTCIYMYIYMYIHLGKFYFTPLPHFTNHIIIVKWGTGGYFGP